MNWDHLSDILKALSHPIRLQIAARLAEQDENVGALARELELRPAAVSQQLAILRMRNLVSKTNHHGRAVYTLEEPRLRELLSCVVRCDRPDSARADAGERSSATDLAPVRTEVLP